MTMAFFSLPALLQSQVFPFTRRAVVCPVPSRAFLPPQSSPVELVRTFSQFCRVGKVA